MSRANSRRSGASRRRALNATRRLLARSWVGSAAALFAAQGFTALAFLVLARRMSVEQFGAFASVYAAGLALGAALDFGSSRLRVRDLSQGIALETFSSWLRRRTLFQIIPILLLLPFTDTLFGGTLSGRTTFLLISQALTYPVALALIGAVQALQSPVLSLWIMAFGNATMLSLALLAPSRDILLWSSIGATGSWVISSSISWLLVRQRLSCAGREGWSGSPWAGSMGFGLLGLSAAMQGLQLVIIGAQLGPSSSAALAAIARWIQPVHLLGMAFASQAFPRMAAAKSDWEAEQELRTAKIPVLVGLAAVASIILLSPLLVRSLLGDQYSQSSGLLRATAVASIPIVLSQPVAIFLQARGSELSTARISTIGLFTTLAGTSVLSLRLGPLAAPLAFGVSQCVVLFLLASQLRTHRSKRLINLKT